MKSMENPKPKSTPESPKDMLDYLNKARQGSVEYEDVYRTMTKERPDLLKKFAVGKNGEPYKNTRDAAHDLIEYLANEAEGGVGQKENEIKQKKFKEEIDSQKNLLDLLNKARQGSVEHEDVYWHVFGGKSKSGAPYPASLTNRSDLLEKFAVGKNDEPYKNTRDAAHDLIEYLAGEAEGKIKQLTPEKKRKPSTPEEKKKKPDMEEKPEDETKKTPEGKDKFVIILIDLLEKAKGGDVAAVKILIEFVVTHKIEITIVGPKPSPEEVEAQRILIILLERI